MGVTDLYKSAESILSSGSAILNLADKGAFSKKFLI